MGSIARPLTWLEWQRATKRLYRLPGWPRAEMYRYFCDGLSPPEAKERAIRRRLPKQVAP